MKYTATVIFDCDQEDEEMYLIAFLEDIGNHPSVERIEHSGRNITIFSALTETWRLKSSLRSICSSYVQIVRLNDIEQVVD